MLRTKGSSRRFLPDFTNEMMIAHSTDIAPFKMNNPSGPTRNERATTVAPPGTGSSGNRSPLHRHTGCRRAKSCAPDIKVRHAVNALEGSGKKRKASDSPDLTCLEPESMSTSAGDCTSLIMKSQTPDGDEEAMNIFDASTLAEDLDDVHASSTLHSEYSSSSFCEVQGNQSRLQSFEKEAIKLVKRVYEGTDKALYDGVAVGFEETMESMVFLAKVLSAVFVEEDLDEELQDFNLRFRGSDMRASVVVERCARHSGEYFFVPCIKRV